jgi:hypothetical protein
MALTSCKECGAQVSTKAQACPKCGAKRPKKSILLRLLLAAILLPLAVSMFSGKGTTPTERANVGETSSAVAAAPKTQTDLSDLDFDFVPTKVGFGNIMEISGKITNRGPSDVKDVAIECISKGSSGTAIDKNKRVLYESVPAGKSHKFGKLNMGFLHTQAASTECSLIAFAHP